MCRLLVTHPLRRPGSLSAVQLRGLLSTTSSMSISYSQDRPILPQELIEHIFSFLTPVTDRKARSALEICAYASPSLHVISQQRLFHQVILHPECAENNPPTISFKRLASILDTSPHIAAYIRRLKVICVRDRMVAVPHWLEEDWDSSCLAPLDNLREIWLSWTMEAPRRLNHINRPPVDWGVISPYLRVELLVAIASSSLTRLDLSGVPSFPAEFFHALPDTLASLKHLNLPDLSFASPPSKYYYRGRDVDNKFPSDWFSTQPLGSTHPQLDSLVFEDMTYLKRTIMWMLDHRCPIDVNRLRCLRLSYKDMHKARFGIGDEDISRLLRRCAGSLEDLRIFVNEESENAPFIGSTPNTETGRREYSTLPFKFTPLVNGRFQMTALKHLTLDGDIYARYPAPGYPETERYFDPFSWITRFLRDVSSFPSGHCGIQNVTLNILFEQVFVEDILGAVDWVDVAETLTEERFPALVKVEINVHGMGDNHDLRGTSVLQRNTDLRKLEEKGLLSIHTYP
ncbi:hypothetical protein B0H34DRAFT_733446 [Crassisporium funariophilum]|nr:hypothetical protein B0H34DRAFT_733446 [Crassisporium funariophilum]